MTKPRVNPVCSRCAERHHQWAYCKDGVRRVKTAPPFRKGDPLRGAAKKHHEAKAAAVTETGVADAPVTATVSAEPAATSPSAAREELRTLASSMPEGSQQRRAMELLIARDEAREGHQRAEAELRATDPTAHLPLPVILRDVSEDKGRALNSEMDRLLFAAGTSRASQKDILPQEAQSVHDVLTGLEERRERAATAAREAAKPPEHRPGSQSWMCTSCSQRFHTGTMAEVREWARNDPVWRLACPECHSPKVQIIEAA